MHLVFHLIDDPDDHCHHFGLVHESGGGAEQLTHSILESHSTAVHARFSSKNALLGLGGFSFRLIPTCIHFFMVINRS